VHHFFVIAVLVDVLVLVFVLVIFVEGMGKKKYEFAVSLNVKELTEVPYGNGVFFAKVRLLDGGGGGGSFLAFSNREAIVKNKVVWNWKSVFDAKLSSDEETGILASKFLRISIRREIVKWKVTNKKMGFFDINLAEHARGGLVTLKRILEAYDSKNMDNSMLHVTVEMRLMKGDPCYKVPNLSRVEDHYEDFESSGSNWYHHELGSIRFEGAYEDPTSVAADVSHSNNGDARVEYANYAADHANCAADHASAVDYSDDDDDDDEEGGDDNDDSAFVTANDVSVEPLESSRKMSFSSPNVARADLDDFISPILSSPQPPRNNGHTSNLQHQHISATPPVRPRRNRHDNNAAFRKKMSIDSSGVLQGALDGRGGGGGGVAAGLQSASSMRHALLRSHKSDASTMGITSVCDAISSASSMPPPELPPQATPFQQQHQHPQHQHQQPQHSSLAGNSGAGSTTSSIERNSFKRTHRRDMSAGTKTTMLWLKASEEYAEERRRRADLPPCVSADDVVDDILQEFDKVKKASWERGDVAENSGLKLSDVQ